MRCLCSATFEFDLAPQVSWRGEIVAASAESVVRNAVKALRRAHPNRQWRSMVVVILERLDADIDAEHDAIEPALSAAD